MKMRLHRSLYRILSPLAALLLLSLFLAFTGCGGAKSESPAGDSSDPPPAAPTVTITANPASINAGSSSALTVAATDATAVTVTGSDGSSYNLMPTGGTQKVTPAATATYTATATGAGGKASGTATVTVGPPPPGAPTVTIAANPASITAGSSSTLTVAATNATVVKVTGSDGSSYNLTPSGGTQVVTPASTATYTATATGTAGNASATTTVTVVAGLPAAPTVTIEASPTSITAGADSTLTVTATHSTAVSLTGSDGSSYKLAPTGGTQNVTPAVTTTYTAEATAAAGNASATATVTVTPVGTTQAINHVIFMMQENHTFDNYFGMLNPYRRSNNMNVGDDGNIYNVDGIDDKLNTANVTDEGVSIPLYKFKSSCIDDASSAWLESYGDVNRYNFLTSRPILADGFVHNAEGFNNSCVASGVCSGDFTDTSGQRAMGYYDQDFLNYYYYMASEFAVSDRWFSPIASKSNPNRIATYSGGTTQGLAFDPGYDDHVGSLNLPTIFKALDDAKVSWKVYYTDTAGECGAGEDDCGGSGSANYPATALGYITYTKKYLYPNPTHAACTGTTQASNVVGDSTNYFCIDSNHVAPLATYYSDLTSGTLASFTFIEPGYGINDEHPGSFQPVLLGQAQMAKIINAFMASPEWKDGVFFFSYDEGGGPYDHVAPVPHHSNDKTTASDKVNYPVDIASISVNPDAYNPCLPATPPATTHCDLRADSPGAHPGDAAVNGFGAQIGFRVPNIVISPFTRRHYVSHIPMDHTAIIKFVEDRFIGNRNYLTSRDAAQPNLLDFFDFTHTPWATPPTPPAPASNATFGRNTCTPSSM